MPTLDIRCEFHFEAAHWLPHVPEGHQCGRMHGHSYHLTVTVRGPVDSDGFVVDFAEVKQRVNPVIDRLDHHCLNKVIDNPTVELVLIWLWGELHHVPGLYEITLRETPNNSATYRGEHNQEARD